MNDVTITQTLHERIAMIRLARTPHIGPVKFYRLLAIYGTASRALHAIADMPRTNGIKQLIPPSQTQIEDEIAFLEKTGSRHILRSDPDYPLMMAYTPDAPPLLFCRGNIDLASMISVAIVGGRNASLAGIRIAESLSAELASAGICVISGLARGIDTAAHKGALHPGLTVAVIAGALDIAYPPENARLHEAIAEKGCLLTEAPPGTETLARHFPRRNRLIAGISQACLVIEASERSGTLITARHAAAYDRTIMAVPGSPLDPRSRGGNDLLRQGAILVENAQDILSCLPEEVPARPPAPWSREEDPAQLFGTPDPRGFEQAKYCAFRQHSKPFSEPQEEDDLSFLTENEAENPEETEENHKETIREAVLLMLSLTPIMVDDLISRCQFSVSDVMTTLSELEVEGMIESLPGGQVVLMPETA
ncbi:DNA-processing protein DprA [Acetobacteraceae bacterium ESL0709]|nr:DNA-processing protein DprA [Acetobacteraceae bacterium ESL0697]MDF7677467.1 DNA-processing protein DprA [Acetobacteraceae bacterium ESL0709]